MSKTTSHGAPIVKLRPNSMGWIAAAALGAIIMSPAGGIYFNFGPMATTVGKAVPFVFFIAMIVSLPTAFSFAMVARELPSAGSVYTWMRRATKPFTGLYVGWIVFGFYLLAAIVLPGVFALFFNEFLKFFNIGTNYWTWTLGVLLCTAIVVAVDYIGIGVTIKATIIFMAFESTVLLALAITILAKGGYSHSLDFSSFSPSGAGGSTAIFAALIFGIQANVGYDSIAALAEETRNPRRSIPLATIAAVVVVGIYWIIVSWGFSVAVPISNISNMMNQGFTPITPIAQQYWGRGGSLLITVSAMTSITGIYIAQTVGSSRVIYSMGRDRGLPEPLGVLNQQRRLPWRAMTLVVVLTTVVTLVLGKVLGLATQYNWTGTMSAALGLLTYACVNLANIVFFWRYRRNKFNWLTNGLIPGVGLAVCIYVLYKSFGAALWNVGWTYGKSVQLAIAVWLLLGVGWSLYRRGSLQQHDDVSIEELLAEESV